MDTNPGMKTTVTGATLSCDYHKHPDSRPSYASILTAHLGSEKDYANCFFKTMQQMSPSEQLNKKPTTKHMTDSGPSGTGENICDSQLIEKFDNSLARVNLSTKSERLFEKKSEQVDQKYTCRAIHTDKFKPHSETKIQTQLNANMRKTNIDVNKVPLTGHCGYKFANIEEKENMVVQSGKSYHTDNDGWQTRISSVKKIKMDKKVHEHPNTKERRPVEQAKQQRIFQQNFQARGIYRGADTGRNASFRNTQKTDNYNRKATIYYSNRGFPGDRRSSNRDLMNECEASGTNQFRKSVEVFSKLDSPNETVYNPEQIYSLLIRRPELTPPPPPACGTFSYRDVLQKNLQTPPKLSRLESPQLESTSISTHEDISHKVLSTVFINNVNDSSPLENDIASTATVPGANEVPVTTSVPESFSSNISFKSTMHFTEASALTKQSLESSVNIEQHSPFCVNLPKLNVEQAIEPMNSCVSNDPQLPTNMCSVLSEHEPISTAFCQQMDQAISKGQLIHVTTSKFEKLDDENSIVAKLKTDEFIESTNIETSSCKQKNVTDNAFCNESKKKSKGNKKKSQNSVSSKSNAKNNESGVISLTPMFSYSAALKTSGNKGELLSTFIPLEFNKTVSLASSEINPISNANSYENNCVVEHTADTEIENYDKICNETDIQMKLQSKVDCESICDAKKLPFDIKPVVSAHKSVESEKGTLLPSKVIVISDDSNKVGHVNSGNSLSEDIVNCTHSIDSEMSNVLKFSLKKVAELNFVCDDKTSFRNLDTDKLVAPPPTPCEFDISGIQFSSSCTNLNRGDEKSMKFVTSVVKELEIINLTNETNDVRTLNICNVIPFEEINASQVPSEKVSSLLKSDSLSERSVDNDNGDNIVKESILIKFKCDEINKIENDLEHESNCNNQANFTTNLLPEKNTKTINEINEVTNMVSDHIHCSIDSENKDIDQKLSIYKSSVIKPNDTIKETGIVFLPNVSQTWSVDSSNLKAPNDVPLPQRVHKWENMNSTDIHNTNTTDSTVTVETKNEGNDSGVNVPDDSSSKENSSSMLKPHDNSNSSESSGKPKSDWSSLNTNHSSVSTDIYSDLKDDIANSGLPKVSIEAESDTRFISSSKKSVSSCHSQIWSTDPSKQTLNLSMNSILNLDREETIQSLLRNSASSVINIPPVQYYTDASTNICSTINTTSLACTTEVTQAGHLLTSKPVNIALPIHSETCSSNSSAFNKMPDVVSNQCNFIRHLPTSISGSCPTNDFSLISPQNVMSISSENNLVSSIPSLMQNADVNQYMHLSPLQTQPGIQNLQETDFPQTPLLAPGQHMSLQHPLNYIQQQSLQYPGMYDPRWSRNYPMDMSQSEWVNINRFPSNARDFSRPPPPSIRAIPQTPLGMFNYPPPQLQHSQKEGMFQNFNYPPPSFQQGYRLPSLPGFLQRPPPALPPQFTNSLYAKMSPLVHHQSPTDRRNYSSSYHKIEGDKQRPFVLGSFQDMSKGNQNVNFRSNVSRGDRYNFVKLNRSGAIGQPQDPTLADYLPKNMDVFKSEKSSPNENYFNPNWKKVGNFQEKRNYVEKKNNKVDSQDELAFVPLTGTETPHSEPDKQLASGSRQKTSYKGPTLPTESASNKSKSGLNEQKMTVQHNIERVPERSPNQIQYSGMSEVFMQGQCYPNVMKPVGLNANQMTTCSYQDINKDNLYDNMGSIVEFNNVSDKVDYEESRLSGQVDHPQQELCGGGWKYYHETMTSPSGLRIHQNTYVPYPNPCGAMPTTYLSTNDVRARIQWLGFKRAHEVYSSRISLQNSLRMDVTVVCSKGSAVCCNSDILGTCSTYFYERLFGRTEEYLTIFVNVPSKIMKHFLQMMSCGEAFVPINDVNEVIVKAPIFLNLGM